MVLGQNGLLNNSKETAQIYKNSQEKEELSIILSAYYMSNLEKNEDDLETYLNENNAILKDENDDNYIIEHNGYEFTVNKESLEILDMQKAEIQQVIVTENGQEKVLTVSDIAKEPKKYYGAKVTNYTAGGAIYRIFYIDTKNKYGDGRNTVYIKGDLEWDKNYHKVTDEKGIVNEYDANSTRIRQLNPLWSKYRGDSELEWSKSEKESAYLCDSSKWNEYYDKQLARYVIGSPSVEMFIDSYNQTHDLDTNGNKPLCYRYTTYEENGPGYEVGAYDNYEYGKGKMTVNNTIDESNNQLYNSSNSYIWLASPSVSEKYALVYFNDSKRFYYINMENWGNGIMPIVAVEKDKMLKIEI